MTVADINNPRFSADDCVQPATGSQLNEPTKSL